ncbi:PQQ-dependent sugar dehydrogenase [Kibdelosporangium philippinense]|uniref:PQQ-dependent sugar dehydrogenase n=1 Tax=Kibdelosporangium philippinense TaxID=211113 RepID=A0ABS8ZRU7_9PSEU|nr:PQQ-dependent sugar dehydrogenase [Kibdelosporangium philippinense]MCE7010446.1 PQQ-dependent sugar dehydrogenase [Kibdelosporangium philippinense]
MRRTTLLSSALTVVLLVSPLGGTALAHPPDNPYDNTYFAPVKTGGVKIGLEKVVDGLTAPLKGVRAPGHDDRLYVIDQVGKLVAVNLKTSALTTVLDVSSRLVPLGVGGPNTFDERGFLGTAFHPDFARNGLLYTWTSEKATATPTFPTTLPAGVAPDHQNVLAEWTMTAAGVDPASRRELMRIDWPQFNHNAGDIAFGSDGLLYVPTGDGGGSDDEEVGHAGGNAQNATNPLGDILRIDVNKRDSANQQYGIPATNPYVGLPGLVSEIYAIGFRNPWRLSFDGDKLYVGDVGQNDIEEVSLVVNGGNYGWRIKEGTLFFSPNGTKAGTAQRKPLGPVPPGLQDPIAQYDTHHEGHSVIGGFVYRGHEIPQLRGKYVFGEWSRLFSTTAPTNNYGRILYLEERRFGLDRVIDTRGFADEAKRLGLTDLSRPHAAFEQSLSVFGFAEDASGELYVLGNRGGVPFGNGGVMLKLTRPCLEAPVRDSRAGCGP